MNKKTVLLLSTAALLAAGCNDGKKDSLEGDDSETKQPDPVTIRVGVPQQWLTDDEFNRYVVEPVKKKYPWINVVREAYGTGRSLSELVAAGETPDLIAQSNTAGMPDLRNLNLFYPLTEYIAKYKLDLNQFERS